MSPFGRPWEGLKLASAVSDLDAAHITLNMLRLRWRHSSESVKLAKAVSDRDAAHTTFYK